MFNKRREIGGIVFMLVLANLFGSLWNWFLGNPKELAHILNRQLASIAAAVVSPFSYEFKISGILEETSVMDETSSPYWWVNSGAVMKLENGVGKTIQGGLSVLAKWRLIYNVSNPIDTDNGYHPQNIFRLVTRSRWQNFRQEAYFVVTNDNLSASANRNASNGLLLFNRYIDGNNLYYTGVRVDGTAIIKKKINGQYFTMTQVALYPGAPYDRVANPNLLPKNHWIGIRSEIRTVSGAVSIKLYVDDGKTGTWRLVAQTTDNGTRYGASILNSGYAGIRTDFMDVEFDNYKVTSF